MKRAKFGSKEAHLWSPEAEADKHMQTIESQGGLSALRVLYRTSLGGGGRGGGGGGWTSRHTNHLAL